jgi:hypothetical protein
MITPTHAPVDDDRLGLGVGEGEGPDVVVRGDGEGDRVRGGDLVRSGCAEVVGRGEGT